MFKKTDNWTPFTVVKLFYAYVSIFGFNSSVYNSKRNVSFAQMYSDNIQKFRPLTNNNPLKHNGISEYKFLKKIKLNITVHFLNFAVFSN